MKVEVADERFGTISWEVPDEAVEAIRSTGAPDEEIVALAQVLFTPALVQAMGAMGSAMMTCDPTLMHLAAQEMSAAMHRVLEEHDARLQGHM